MSFNRIIRGEESYPRHFHQLLDSFDEKITFVGYSDEEIYTHENSKHLECESFILKSENKKRYLSLILNYNEESPYELEVSENIITESEHSIFGKNGLQTIVGKSLLTTRIFGPSKNFLTFWKFRFKKRKDQVTVIELQFDSDLTIIISTFLFNEVGNVLNHNIFHDSRIFVRIGKKISNEVLKRLSLLEFQ